MQQKNAFLVEITLNKTYICNDYNIGYYLIKKNWPSKNTENLLLIFQLNQWNLPYETLF